MKTYITEWDGITYNKIRDIRRHIEMLSKNDQREMIGCPVIKTDNKIKERIIKGYIAMKLNKCIIKKN